MLEYLVAVNSLAGREVGRFVGLFQFVTMSALANSRPKLGRGGFAAPLGAVVWVGDRSPDLTPWVC